MNKLEPLKARLRELTVDRAALWFSGGMDSRLLLEVILAEALPCAIFRFDDGWTREQKRAAYQAVEGRNLSLYSYRAAHFLLLGDGEQASLAGFYPIAPGYSLPIVRDFVPGTRHVDSIPFEIDDHLPIGYANIIVGSRSEDQHYTLGQPWRQTSLECGPCTIHAPLYEWTSDDVAEALALYGIEYVKPEDSLDTGNIPICPECLEAIRHGGLSCSQPEPVWQPKQNLELFQQMIGV
jgi:hypothetical protein